MEKRIVNLVDAFFEDIPYCEEVLEARGRIAELLNAEYIKLAEKSSGSKAFERIVEQYGTLSSMAVFAGYTAEDAARWQKDGGAGVVALKALKKEMNAQRRRSYLVSALCLSAIIYLIEIPLVQNIYLLVFSAISGVLALFAFYRYMKREYVFVTGKNIPPRESLWAMCCSWWKSKKERQNTEEKEIGCRYDTEAYQYLRSLCDRYVKRSLNGIALLLSAISMFLFLELSFFILGNSKWSEVMENIYANMIVVELPIYLCIKNAFCIRLVWHRLNLLDRKKYREHFAGMAFFSALYWLAAGLGIVFFQDKNTVRHSVNLLFAAGCLFVFIVFVYNFTVRKKITYKNIILNKKRVAVFTSIAVFTAVYFTLQKDTWYTQPYINATPVVEHTNHKISYNEKNGVYTITSVTEDFKILHLTDIHLGGSLYSYRKDLKALKAVYAEILYTKPDLVIVTGDLTFPLGVMSLSLNNSAPVSQFAAFMRNIGIPWAFTYGNHDTEGIATLSKGDLDKLYQSLSYKTSGNLLYPYVQPDVTGRNNQLIEIRNSDGTLNHAIFLIDSNAYTGEGLNVYDYIHDDQVEWYAQEVERLNREEERIVPSMVFFHIPLQQYRTAYELYEQGSSEVQYFFGENNEKMIDKVCCSDYPSNLFDCMVELKSTKAVFCGHDHYNNISLEYKGIRLTYGMSIDYLAMPGIEYNTKQRGAELIWLHSDGSWELCQIPLNSIVSDKRLRKLESGR